MLVSLCGTMWAIPTLIQALETAPAKLGGSGLPGAADVFRPSGTEPEAPMMSQWLNQRTAGEREADALRIMGSADPGMTEAERLALLEEAHENAPKPPEQKQR